MHKLIMGEGIYIHKNGKNFDNRKCNLISTRGYKNNGKTFLNGYIAIYIPEHERAFDNGCVYEHILVAEDMLNRKLEPNECVHHIDLDRTNNTPANLMVFKTEKDHIAFHGGAKAELRDDGSYECEENRIDYFEYMNRTKSDIGNNIKDIGSLIIIKDGYRYNLCPVCKSKIKTIEAKTCIDCYNKIKGKNIPPKEVLSNLIYKQSFESIGRLFNVTGNNVKKWCKKYNLPCRKKDLQLIQ